MKEILLTTKEFTAVDKFNIKMARALKEMAGQTMVVSKVAVGTDLDQDQKETASAAFITDKGNFATISGTVCELATALVEIIDENGPQNIAVDSRKANNGREYLVLTLIG